MNNESIQRMQGTFDSLAQTLPDDGSIEFWFARDLQEPLGYARWENFMTAIQRAIESCETTGYKAEHHFRGVTKMVSLGSGAERRVSGFYRSCKVLCESQELCLEDLFGEDEARNAEELLAEKRTQVKGVVEDKIAAHSKVFKAKTPAEQKLSAEAAGKEAEKLSYQGHHETNCPACGSPASISGTSYGTEKVSHEDGEVVVRQPVSPRGLQCTACGLTLSSYAELEVAGLAGRYTRTSSYTPEEYFGLVDPSTSEPDYEYDNE